MAEISRTALFGKLNPLAYKAIEGATVLCKMRGNPYVELQHWLTQILNTQDSDLHRIVKHYELDASQLVADLTRALDRLPRGASSVSDLSSFIEDAVERAWVYGSLMFGERQVRSGHLIVGMLKTASLRNTLFSISRQFERVKLDDLCDRFTQLLAGSPEAQPDCLLIGRISGHAEVRVVRALELLAKKPTGSAADEHPVQKLIWKSFGEQFQCGANPLPVVNLGQGHVQSMYMTRCFGRSIVQSLNSPLISRNSSGV